MARPKISNAALSDLAMGANSAAQAVAMYREAGQLDEREPSVSTGGLLHQGRLKAIKVESAVAQAKLACRFLVQFIQRHGGKEDQDVAHEIEHRLGGDDADL